MENQNKSENIVQLEQFVQPGCIITLDTDSQYLLKKVLGFGFFGITFYAVALTSQMPVAIKIQSEDRGQIETAILEKIRNEYQHNLVRFWETGEIVRIKNAFGQYASNLTINYQRWDTQKIQAEINSHNPEVIAALTVLQSQAPEAQSQKADAWKKLMDIGAITSRVKKLTAIVMEFVNGQPLDKAFSQKTDVITASHIIQEIITAIECLHNHRLIHGDLKPENIIIDQSDHVKVLDFSTAKVEGSINPNIATSSYAPFRQRIAGEVNRYSDIFSIGAIFYRMVTGKEPTIDYFYQLSEGNNKEALVTAHVRKHLEGFALIPDEQKNILARIFTNEINSLPDIVTSESQLQSRMAMNKPFTGLGFGQSILAAAPVQPKNIVVDYVPDKVLAVFHKKKYAPYLKVSELARDFKLIKTRAVLRIIRSKFELVSQVATILIAIYALLTSFSQFRTLIPTLAAPTATSIVSEPTSEQRKSIDVLQQEADYHFDKGVDEHNNAVKATEIAPQNQHYQVAYDEYEKAAAIYQSILDRRSELDQKTIGATNTSLGIVKMNEAIIYLGQHNYQNAILKNLEALEYLEVGYDQSPSSFKLDQLIKCKYILGFTYIDAGDYDNGLSYYEEVLGHLTDSNLDAQSLQDYRSYLLELLNGIDTTQVTPAQQTRINDLIDNLNNLHQSTPST
jgi:serine/threonine protein kinase